MNEKKIKTVVRAAVESTPLDRGKALKILHMILETLAARGKEKKVK